MFKVELLNLGFGSVVFRYYLMMAVVVVAGFAGIWPLALLALPIFISAILGLSVRFVKEEAKYGSIKPVFENKKKVA